MGSRIKMLRMGKIRMTRNRKNHSSVGSNPGIAIIVVPDRKFRLGRKELAKTDVPWVVGSLDV